MSVRRPLVNEIKESLKEMPMHELEQMSTNLSRLLQVLMARQVAVEDTILERLEEAFSHD
jgi:hypothetical protein